MGLKRVAKIILDKDLQVGRAQEEYLLNGLGPFSKRGNKQTNLLNSRQKEGLERLGWQTYWFNYIYRMQE